MPARSRPKGGRPSVTIRDIARRAGVSTATVSRVLANPERVAPSTRDAVITAIEATGYAPNAAARSLRARSTKMVLALLPGIGHSFYTPILNAIEEVLSFAGYGVIMGDTRRDRDREAHYDLLVRSGQVDGVLLLTGRLPAPDFAALNTTIPITLLCNDIPGLSGLPVIEIQNHEAAEALIGHLIDLGHRRIGHARGPADNVEAQYRFSGYKAALKKADLKIDQSIVWEGAFSLEAGAQVARQFLEHPDPPTAMFAANDEMALGFIKAVKAAGLSVPRDVSVAGFDDIEYARFFDPALTTIHQPRGELGRLAAENLLARMAGETSSAPLRMRLPCTLITRDSTQRIEAGTRRRPKAARTAPVA